MQDTEEIWKDVVGYEGLYLISNKGNVIKLDGWRKRKRKFSFSNGYAQTSLSKAVNSRKVVSVHRLVAEAFIPNPENKPNINHINSIRSDNRVENLEWCTQSENILHSYRVKSNRKHTSRRKTNIEKIKKIIHLRHNHNLSLNHISRLTSVNTATIQNIVKNKKWDRFKTKEFYIEILHSSFY